jgi:hypothetical protein
MPEHVEYKTIFLCVKCAFADVVNVYDSSFFSRDATLSYAILVFNLPKPTGYVMYHQFNIQQLYALPTLYLCVLYLSEKKQRLVPLTA